MRFLFRTDASLRIGTGHVMRCLTLADSLRKRGSECDFVCRELDGNLIELIGERHGFRVHVLPPPQVPRAVAMPPADATGEPLPSHYPWLEANWWEDAEETIEALRGGRADWLVVDHYALDARWQERLRPFVGRIFVIDDVADRRHACDYLLDQNLYDGPEERYAARVTSSTRLLLGPEFALLRPEFAEMRRRTRPREGKPSRALVFFGGADAVDATTKALDALSAPEFSALAADVVVGAVNPRKDAVASACARRPGTVFHCQAGNMAELMARCDLSLGAGGTASWERCCLGLPTLAAYVADNQRELTRTLARHGILIDLGDGSGLTGARIAEDLRQASAKPETLANMSRLGMSIVDGEGVGRVAERLLNPPQQEGSLGLRRARASDMLTYFRWTNEAETRKQSYRTDPIPLADHARWFATRLEDPGTRLWVAECGGEPAGQIRFQKAEDVVWIGFSVDPRYRGRGIGAYLLQEGAKELERDPAWAGFPVRGSVKASNPSSLKTFLKAGYVQIEKTVIQNEPSYIFQFPQGTQ